MKTATHLLILAVFLFLAGGCKPSNRVTFKPANMSIDLGEGWKHEDMPSDDAVCSPGLVGQSGWVHGLVLVGNTDIKEAAHTLQIDFSKNTNAVADSFKQEDFTTDSGLTGVHLSFTFRLKDGKFDARSHNFITHNMVGTCVSISYITTTNDESPSVLEAIRKTLQVE
jgi:hypothetical protein